MIKTILATSDKPEHDEIIEITASFCTKLSVGDIVRLGHAVDKNSNQINQEEIVAS